MIAAPKHHPWMKWYPRSWLGEARLKLCGRPARSLWFDMLNLMHGSDPFGFLMVEGVPLDNAQLARVLGDNEDDTSAMLAELERSGVFSRVGAANLPRDIIPLIPAGVPVGTIFSRKMLRDFALSKKGKENGRLGGNPLLVGGDKDGVNPEVKGGGKPQSTEDRRQTTLLRNAAGAAGPKGWNAKASTSKPLDDKDWLWREGVPWLCEATGRPQGGIRSRVGKWLKALREDASGLRNVIHDAQDQQVAEPISWITAAVARRAASAVPLIEQTDEIGWRKRMESYRANGAWLEKWGGRKPGDHPDHPPRILAEFGFRKDAA